MEELAASWKDTPVKATFSFDITGKTVILVDDVIYKGRTIRAALNAINEYGRPEIIRLLVLIDRGHRELPIHPDFIGKKLPTSSKEQVKVYFQETDGRDAVELIKNNYLSLFHPTTNLLLFIIIIERWMNELMI